MLQSIQALIITITITAFSFATNLVVNGDFESWDDATHPTGWTKAENIDQESATVNGGSYAAKHTGGTKDLSQYIDVVGGHSHTITINYNVETENGTDGRLWSYWKDASGGSLSSGDIQGWMPDSPNAWSVFEVTTNAPADAAQLYLEFRTYSGGVVIWDDISVVDNDAGGGPTCSDGIQNQDETGIDCGGVCDVCLQSATYDWSNGATVLGTSGNNITVANVGDVLEITEDPLSGTPQAWVAAVSGLSGGETVEVCLDLMGDVDGDSKGRLWGHYYDGTDFNSSDGSASGSNSYGDDWGNWENNCHTWTVADGKAGLVVELRIYSSGDGGVVKADNLSVSVSGGTVHFPELPATCDDTNACNNGAEGDCEYVNVGWGNLQYPASTTSTTGVASENIYGQVHVDGVSGSTNSESGIVAELGYGVDGSSSDTWIWAATSLNGSSGNNDEFVGQLTIADAGTYSYSYRYQYNSSCWYNAAEVGSIVVSGPPACDAATDCSGNGSTDDTDSSDGCVCTCNSGWTGDDCSTAVTYAITFNVDMNYEDVDATEGVRIFGLSGWDAGDAITLLDDDADGVYSTTIDLPAGTYEFKYRNGWSYENVDNLSCAIITGSYWNRALTVTDVSMQVDLGTVCFGACEVCIAGCTDTAATNYDASATTACNDNGADNDCCTYPGAPDGLVLYLNEIHYDNASTDVDEAVEVVATAGLSADELAQITLTKYNGGGGVEYGSATLDSFTEGVTVDGLTYYSLLVGSNGLQNGAPDGVSLSGWGTLYQFLSYEGTVDATDGPAMGQTSTDIGASESSSTGSGTSIQYYGTDGWVSGVTASLGQVNPIVCFDTTACSYAQVGDCTYANPGFNCNGDALINVTFQVNMAEQTVDTEGNGLDLYLDDPYGYYDMLDDDSDGVWSVTLSLVVNTQYAYKFKNGEDWEVNFNDLGCGAGDTYGNRTFTSGESDSTLDAVCFNSCSDCVVACTVGDINGDDDINVLDVVVIVNSIVNGDDYTACADINGDGSVNVLDIVALVSNIVGGRFDDASSAKLIKSTNGLILQADGYIGGVQMTLRHDPDFTINLSDNTWISDYSTKGYQTILVLVQPSEGELFTTSSDFEIVDMIVANSQGEINATIATNFSISDAYPNPFNPTTTVELMVPEAGHISVMVYNITGQLIAELANSYMDANQYQFTWQGENVPSGMYLLRAEYAGQVFTQKLMLLK